MIDVPAVLATAIFLGSLGALLFWLTGGPPSGLAALKCEKLAAHRSKAR